VSTNISKQKRKRRPNQTEGSLYSGRYDSYLPVPEANSLARHCSGSSMSSANSRYPWPSSRKILFNSVFLVSEARLSFSAASCKCLLDFSVDPRMAVPVAN
jgi:hypothetical protein